MQQGNPTALERLRPEEVHLWYAFTDRVDPGLLGRYADVLAPEERERADRFVFEKDRNSSMISWALVRTTLSRYANLSPLEWRFRREEFGKPEIDNEALPVPLRFNLSHTHGLSACAVHLRRDIGVDVEYIERKSATLEIAQRSFAPSEVEELLQRSAEAQRDRFFDYWTLKEAYIKAVGRGISIGLQEFAFDLSNPGRPSVRFSDKLDDDPTAWSFFQDHPGPVHRAALAVRAPSTQLLDLTIRAVVPLE